MNTCLVPCAPAAAKIFTRMNLLPPDVTRSRGDQARDLLLQMEQALQQEGMTFANVVRTWFHLDEILDWYGEFNAVRSTFFRERQVTAGVVPASTGVGRHNPGGAAIMGGILAIRPHDAAQVTVQAVPSPLQCSALDYRSDFSRAVEVAALGRRTLYISGTASIDPAGASILQDDVDGQIRWTMQVVDALLQSRGMSWNNHVRRAIAYFPDLAHAPLLDACCRAQQMDLTFVEKMEATICRSDLLFEIEVDAESAPCL